MTDDPVVVKETINAYRVQKLADGRVRIDTNGLVATADTYNEALRQYAKLSDHVIDLRPSEEERERRRESIHDGSIPLKRFDSDGFTPKWILHEVTEQPVETVLADLDGWDDE